LAGNWEKKLCRLLACRKANTTWWASFFEQNSLAGISNLVCKNEHIPELLRFPVLIKDAALREALLLESEKMGRGISATYPLSLDELPEVKSNGLTQCPVAQECARTLVTLPVHQFVSKHDREKIIKIIAQTCTG
jgi:dTDP-4-amino-4,6-dideoxygalactose transaminase